VQETRSKITEDQKMGLNFSLRVWRWHQSGAPRVLLSSNQNDTKADTTIPQALPCTRLANLILAPKQERQRIAAYIPRWGIQLAAHLSENTAWAIYRDRLNDGPTGIPSQAHTCRSFVLTGAPVSF
jgi:hypothetical protein